MLTEYEPCHVYKVQAKPCRQCTSKAMSTVFKPYHADSVRAKLEVVAINILLARPLESITLLDTDHLSREMAHKDLMLERRMLFLPSLLKLQTIMAWTR